MSSFAGGRLYSTAGVSFCDTPDDDVRRVGVPAETDAETDRTNKNNRLKYE